jgi:hypothetical protein
MSYISTLVYKAVNQIAENNKIGKYTIRPLHNSNIIYKYYILKEDRHILYIIIYGYTAEIEVCVFGANGNEIKETVCTLQSEYPKFIIKTI